MSKPEGSVLGDFIRSIPAKKSGIVSEKPPEAKIGAQQVIEFLRQLQEKYPNKREDIEIIERVISLIEELEGEGSEEELGKEKEEVSKEF